MSNRRVPIMSIGTYAKLLVAVNIKGTEYEDLYEILRADEFFAEESDQVLMNFLGQFVQRAIHSGPKLGSMYN